MAKGADLIVNIITDASKASAGIDQANGKFGKFNDTITGLAGPAAGVLGGITAMGVVALNAASDLQQAAGGVDAVFGESADQIHNWAKTAATSVGLSEAKYSSMATTLGASLKNMGVPMKDVAGQTDEMIRLGADLAATYGGSTEEAVSALGSALRGEADPAERYGLALSASAVNAELAARGLSGLEGEALTAAKAQITMEKASEQAGGAVGMFASESDTLAGSQATLTASMEDTAAALGEALLPMIQPVVAALAEFAGWIQDNASWITPLIIGIGLLAAGILAYTAIQWALNAAMAANPIALIIIGVIALVAAFIWLWNNVEGFRNFFISIWEGIQAAVAAVVTWFQSAWAAVSAWFQSTWTAVTSFFKSLFIGIIATVASVTARIRSVVGTVASFFQDVWRNAVSGVKAIIKTLQSVFISVFSAIMTPINAVIGAFQTVVSWIQNIISALGRIKIPDVFGAIGGILGGLSANATVSTVGMVPVVSGTSLSAVSPRNAIGAGGGTVININGGLDSADTIARRIGQIMESRNRRESGVRIVRNAK